MLRVICLLIALASLAFGGAGAARARSPAAFPSAPVPLVIDLRVGSYTGVTRFVMEFSEPVDAHVFTLTAPDRVVVDLPAVIWQPAAAAAARTAAKGLIAALRYGPFRSGVTRVVLQLVQPVRLRQTVVLAAQQGHRPRLILDLAPTDPASYRRDLSQVHDAPVVTVADGPVPLSGAAADPPPAMTAIPVTTASAAPVSVTVVPMTGITATAAPSRSASPPAPGPMAVQPAVTQPVMLTPASDAGPSDAVPAVLTRPSGTAPPARVTPVSAGTAMMMPLPPRFGRRPPIRPREKPLIAIDPGHGGIDPGAHAVTGINEKVITLATARVLRQALLATGRYRVFLTRDADVFLPLRERVAHARAAGASLFISLHADSIHNHDVRGMSIYTLSDKASDREAGTLAERENRADALGGVNLATESDQVASILIDLAQRDTRNQSRQLASAVLRAARGEIRMLPRAERAAGLAVLTAPDVPSVLIEMGYLSNATDARLLASPDHQRRFAQTVLHGIDSFFARRSRIRHP